MLDALKEFLHYLDPANLIELIKATYGLKWVLPVLAFIIFAETGLMFGFFLPGDSLLFFTGTLLGHQDASLRIDEHVGLVLIVLILAAIVGDQVGYLTGRQIGHRLYKLPDRWYFKRAHIEKTKSFYDRHGGKTIILGRFVPIVRTFAPIVAGVAPLAYNKFIPYNIIGGIVWICSMVLSGYYLGQFIPREWLKYVTLGIIIASVLPILITALQERRRTRQLRAEATNQTQT